MGASAAGSAANVPLEQLLEELPLEEGGLVPLVVLVERITNMAYQTIQSLGDTLSSLPTDAKRAKIYATALELRRLLVKLLVLVRWSKDAEMLNRARNVIALLVEQQWAHEDVFSGLTQVRKIIPNARMSDADFVTAIDVLRTGTYQRLPASIKDSSVIPTPLSDADARKIMTNLDQVLRVRLAWTESVPVGLHLLRISDGKAYLEAPGLYDMCLTVSGPEAHDRWWLLDFHFADPVELEEQRIEPILTESYLHYIFEMAETMLSSDDQNENQPALMRLHDALEQEALQRQLHIMHHQIQRMVRLNWGRHLSFALDVKARELKLWYWTSRGEGMMHKNMLQGHLKLCLESLPLHGTHRIISEIIAGTKVSVHQNRIDVQWHIDDKLRKYVPEDEQACSLEHLDVESLLLTCITRHTRALMKCFEADIRGHTGLGANNPGLCRLCTHNDGGYNPRFSLQLELSDMVHVMLYISTVSGKIGMRLLNTPEKQSELVLSLSQSQNATLQRMADMIQKDLSCLADTLFSFRLQCLTKSLQLQAAWLGLPCTTSISLRTGELNKLGMQMGQPLVYVPLGILPNYYLMLYFEQEQQLGMALVLIVSQVENDKTTQVISSVKWLDKAYLSHFSLSGTELVNESVNAGEDYDTHSKDSIRSEELELALNYCIAIVVYSHLEEQLRLKLVPFALVGGTSNIAPPPTNSSPDPILPSLGIEAHKLLTVYQDLVHPNMSLQLCDWWLPSKRRIIIQFKCKLEIHCDLQRVQLYDNMDLDPKSGILTFTCHELATSLTQLQQTWEQVARMCVLIDTSRTWIYPGFTLGLQSLASRQVSMIYGEAEKKHRYFLQVKFNKVDLHQPARYSLSCGVCTDSTNDNTTLGIINPHQYILKMLEETLNSSAHDAKKLWTFMFYVRISESITDHHQSLAITLPILNLLHAFIEQAIISTDCPDVEILGLTWYRVRFFETHALDIRILSNDRLLISDAYQEAGNRYKSNNMDEVSQEQLPLLSSIADLKPLPDLAKLWNTLYQDSKLSLPSMQSHAPLAEKHASTSNFVLTTKTKGIKNLMCFCKNIQKQL